MDGPPSCSVVVLTMGDRPAEVRALVDSIDGDFEGILVTNGAEAPVPAGWKEVASAENVGIAAGRHLGACAASGDVLVFLDDDCIVRTPDVIAKITNVFENDAALGALALKIVVKETNDSLSEWQPRIRGLYPNLSGQVTWFAGGAHAVRRSAYEQVGGYAPEFFYAHEESDLAWRLLDDDWTIEYRADLVAEHPLTKPARHRKHLWYSARNRVWLARRNLPHPISALYLAVWGVLQIARCHSMDELRSVAAGTKAGVADFPGPRRPMRWSTVAAMTRLGRPPII